jgi:hypothetical protein
VRANSVSAHTEPPALPAEDVQPKSGMVTLVRSHPVVAVFVAALAVRVVVAIVLAASGWTSRIAPDSRIYVRLAERMAGLSDTPWDARSRVHRDRFGTYLVPVAGLFRVFGPHVILAQLVAALFAAVAAAAATRLAIEVLRTSWALGVGAVVAFYPSLVVWSSVPLRDSAVWATTACLALAIVLISRARSIPRFALLAATIGGLLYLLGHLRLHVQCIAGIALVIQAVVGPARYRVATVVIAVALAVFIPWQVGAGPGGYDYIRDRDVGDIRAAHAEEAESALSLGDTDLAHLPRGLVVILAEPFPWTSLRGTTVTAARVEAPLWWVLVLASFSVLPLLWRKRRVLGFPALYATGLLFVLAVAEGNFGTAYRHRGELVWPMALLGAVGLHALWTRCKPAEVPSDARAAP